MSEPTMRFSHMGVAVPNLAQAITVHQQVLGYELVRGPYDDPVQQASVCFLRSHLAGQPEIELVAPLGDHSSVRKILDKGMAAYHLCYEVDDLAAALEHVRRLGCIVVKPPAPAVAFEGRRIAWFYTPLRQLMEFVER